MGPSELPRVGSLLFKLGRTSNPAEYRSGIKAGIIVLRYFIPYLGRKLFSQPAFKITSAGASRIFFSHPMQEPIPALQVSGLGVLDSNPPTPTPTL